MQHVCDWQLNAYCRCLNYQETRAECWDRPCSFTHKITCRQLSAYHKNVSLSSIRPLSLRVSHMLTLLTRLLLSVLYLVLPCIWLLSHPPSWYLPLLSHRLFLTGDEKSNSDSRDLNWSDLWISPSISLPVYIFQLFCFSSVVSTDDSSGGFRHKSQGMEKAHSTNFPQNRESHCWRHDAAVNICYLNHKMSALFGLFVYLFIHFSGGSWRRAGVILWPFETIQKSQQCHIIFG